MKSGLVLISCVNKLELLWAICYKDDSETHQQSNKVLPSLFSSPSIFYHKPVS